MTILKALRGQFQSSEEKNYILVPKTFSYRTFYNTYKDLNNSKGIYADYWHSEEDHHIGLRKEGQVTVEGINIEKTLGNAERAIKELTGAVSVRLTSDLP